MPNLKYGIYFTAVILLLSTATACVAAPQLIPNKFSCKNPENAKYTICKSGVAAVHKYFDHDNKNITTFHTKYNKKKAADNSTAKPADNSTAAKNQTDLQMPNIDLQEDEELQITAPKTQEMNMQIVPEEGTELEITAPKTEEITLDVTPEEG